MQQLVNGGHVGDITTFFVQHLQLDMQKITMKFVWLFISSSETSTSCLNLVYSFFQ